MYFWYELHAYHSDLVSSVKAEKRTPNLPMPNLFWASFRFLVWFSMCCRLSTAYYRFTLKIPSIVAYSTSVITCCLCDSKFWWGRRTLIAKWPQILISSSPINTTHSVHHYTKQWCVHNLTLPSSHTDELFVMNVWHEGIMNTAEFSFSKE